MDFDKILQEVKSMSTYERKIAEHCVNEEEAIYAIKNSRKYRDDWSYSMSGMLKDKYKNRFTPHNERAKGTSSVLYEDMDD